MTDNSLLRAGMMLATALIMMAVMLALMQGPTP